MVGVKTRLWRVGRGEVVSQRWVRFREAEAYTAPSPPAKVAGKWRLFRSVFAGSCFPGGECLHSLMLPALGVFYFLSRGLILSRC